MIDEAFADTAALVRYVEVCTENLTEMATTLARLRHANRAGRGESAIYFADY